MNILYCYGDLPEEWNCSQWRCVIPSKAINRTEGNEARLIYIGDWAAGRSDAAELTRWADVIVLERVVISQTLAMIMVARSQGKAIVVDLDDGYHRMPMGIRAYNFWINGVVETPEGKQTLRYRPLEQLTWGVKLATILTSPSETILNDWKERVGCRTAWSPNYFETSNYLREEPHIPNDPLTIGWGGSSSHLNSFAESNIVPALKRLLQRRNIRFVIAGGDRRIMQLFGPRNGWKGSITVTPWTSVEDWGKVVNSFDIGIAPLDSQYDQRRSWIKGVEYTLAGIPWVYSQGRVYESVGTGIGVKNQARWWEEALSDVLDNYPMYLDKAQEHKKSYTRWDIDCNIDKILDIYRQAKELAE